jgi:ATP-dependent helicase/nuclease subunit A
MWGLIDRLVVTGDSIVALDFKTNRVVPQSGQPMPEGILRQMAAYWRMVQAQVPGQNVRMGVLWTVERRISWLDTADMETALQRAWAEIDDTPAPQPSPIAP